MGIGGGKCTSQARLDGVTAVITGSNGGIGKITAEDFYTRGARVIMACRDISRAQIAADDIKRVVSETRNKATATPGEPLPKLGDLLVKHLDLGCLASVRTCAEDLLQSEPKIQLLINNAGVMMCAEGQTEDGFETQFGTNHLGHFLLTIMLLPRLIESAPSRIVNVSSLAHVFSQLNFSDLNWKTRRYNPRNAYSESKLANVLFTRELARRLKLHPNGNGVTVYSLHPGVIKTDLSRHLDSAFFPGVRWFWNNVASWVSKTPLQGAQTTINCAVAEDLIEETGLYYSDCKVKTPSAAAQDDAAAERLWEESLKLVKWTEDPLPYPRHEDKTQSK